MTIHIFGGGTIQHVRSHMALCAPARGKTARALKNELARRHWLDVQLHETSMANPYSSMETNQDVEARLREVLADPSTRAIVFNVALCDFEGSIGDVPSGKYAERLQTRAVEADGLQMTLRPAPKLLGLIRALRPDVVSVGFKTTADQSPQVQLERAARMAGESGITWVLANDVVTRNNLVVAGADCRVEAARYAGTDREAALDALCTALLETMRHG